MQLSFSHEIGGFVDIHGFQKINDAEVSLLCKAFGYARSCDYFILQIRLVKYQSVSCEEVSAATSEV